MARKTLLNESEIRRFMKLACIEPLAENGFGSFAPNPHLDEEAVEDEVEDELEDPGMEMGAPEDEVDVPVDEPAVDDMGPDLGDEEPGADLGGGDTEEQFMDLVRQLADLVGVEVDMDDGGGDDAMDVGAEDDLGVDDLGGEGGDLEVDDAAMSPEDEEEIDVVDMMEEEDEDDEPGNRSYMEEGNEDSLVAEVARRVAERLQNAKSHNEIAEKLAERIFNRLSAK